MNVSIEVVGVLDGAYAGSLYVHLNKSGKMCFNECKIDFSLEKSHTLSELEESQLTTFESFEAQANHVFRVDDKVKFDQLKAKKEKKNYVFNLPAERSRDINDYLKLPACDIVTVDSFNVQFLCQQIFAHLKIIWWDTEKYNLFRYTYLNFEVVPYETPKPKLVHTEETDDIYLFENMAKLDANIQTILNSVTESYTSAINTDTDTSTTHFCIEEYSTLSENIYNCNETLRGTLANKLVDPAKNVNNMLIQMFLNIKNEQNITVISEYFFAFACNFHLTLPDPVDNVLILRGCAVIRELDQIYTTLGAICKRIKDYVPEFGNPNETEDTKRKITAVVQKTKTTFSPIFQRNVIKLEFFNKNLNSQFTYINIFLKKMLSIDGVIYPKNISIEYKKCYTKMDDLRQELNAICARFDAKFKPIVDISNYLFIILYLTHKKDDYIYVNTALNLEIFNFFENVTLDRIKTHIRSLRDTTETCEFKLDELSLEDQIFDLKKKKIGALKNAALDKQIYEALNDDIKKTYTSIAAVNSKLPDDFMLFDLDYVQISKNKTIQVYENNARTNTLKGAIYSCLSELSENIKQISLIWESVVNYLIEKKKPLPNTKLNELKSRQIFNGVADDRISELFIIASYPLEHHFKRYMNKMVLKHALTVEEFDICQSLNDELTVFDKTKSETISELITDLKQNQPAKNPDWKNQLTRLYKTIQIKLSMHKSKHKLCKHKNKTYIATDSIKKKFDVLFDLRDTTNDYKEINVQEEECDYLTTDVSSLIVTFFRMCNYYTTESQHLTKMHKAISMFKKVDYVNQVYQLKQPQLDDTALNAISKKIDVKIQEKLKEIDNIANQPLHEANFELKKKQLIKEKNEITKKKATTKLNTLQLKLKTTKENLDIAPDDAAKAKVTAEIDAAQVAVDAAQVAVDAAQVAVAAAQAEVAAAQAEVDAVPAEVDAVPAAQAAEALEQYKSIILSMVEEASGVLKEKYDLEVEPEMPMNVNKIKQILEFKPEKPTEEYVLSMDIYKHLQFYLQNSSALYRSEYKRKKAALIKSMYSTIENKQIYNLNYFILDELMGSTATITTEELTEKKLTIYNYVNAVVPVANKEQRLFEAVVFAGTNNTLIKETEKENMFEVYTLSQLTLMASDKDLCNKLKKINKYVEFVIDNYGTVLDFVVKHCVLTKTKPYFVFDFEAKSDFKSLKGTHCLDKINAKVKLSMYNPDKFKVLMEYKQKFDTHVDISCSEKRIENALLYKFMKSMDVGGKERS